MPVVYEQCGLSLRSELPLDLPTVASGAWDVDVVWGRDAANTCQDPPGRLIAERLSPDGAGWWYRATEAADGYTLRFAGTGDVVVSRDLTRVEVRADPATDRSILEVLVAGTVCSFVLTLRGRTVLHASAVDVDGAAVAFAAPSGWGKSTVATVSCLRGAAIVADDVLSIDPGPPPTCQGGTSVLRLRAGAAGLATVRADARSWRTPDDRLALSLGDPVMGPVPLAAIVTPGPSRIATRLDARRLQPAQALVHLLGLSRVEGWCREDVVRRDFDRLSALVNRVPVYLAIVPWGPPFPDAVVGELLDLATAPQ